MQRNDVDIIIIIGPDNPGDNTTQKFIQEKLNAKIAHYEKQGLSCKVIGNGKDPVNPADIAGLPKSQCVIMCGHGSIGQDAHHIDLFKNPPDTNSLIENIQKQTGAKQFILASCYSGKVNDDFRDEKNSIKEGTEVIALSPPDASTSMYFALDSVLDAVNEFGENKGKNKANDLSKMYADLLQSSPNAMSYGVQTNKEYDRYEFDPKGLMYFSGPDSDFIADCRNDGVHYFKNFLEDNNRPPLSDEPASKMSSLQEYSRNLLNDFIYRGDVESISKIIEKCPMVMSRATMSARDYSHQMERMRAWANDDSKYMGMLKLLCNVDMDHNKAANAMGLFQDMKSNALPPANKQFLKCALFELAIETKDSNKRNYLIESLIYAEGSRLFEDVGPQREALLRAKMSPEQLDRVMETKPVLGNNNDTKASTANIYSALGGVRPDALAKDKSVSAENSGDISKVESKSAESVAAKPAAEKQEEHSSNDESRSNFSMRK